MRSKDTSLKKGIYGFINSWKRDYGFSPTLKNIADKMHVSRTTVYRYLKEMSNDGELDYSSNGINTKELNEMNMNLSPAYVVGSIPCGEAQTEEEYVEEYINLPVSLFGKGEFYILRAQGDSMEDAGIKQGDLVIILKQQTAEVGDIVVALDEDNQSTLKRYGGNDKKGHAILQYMNESVYPGKVIKVKQLTVQGVAKHVLKSF